MTIGIAGARVSLNCDGVSKVFPVAIQAYQNTDLSVILTAPTAAGGAQTQLMLNSDYSLMPSGSLQPTAWTLTTLGVNAYPVGYTLQAFINPVQQQQSSYVQGQAFPSLVVQTNLDRLTQMVQRLQDEVTRSIHTPDGDVSPGMLLPPANVRALQYSAFDANGNAITTAALPGTANTAASLGPIINPITQAEINNLVVPTSQIYVEGDLRRYGGDPLGVADSSNAWQSAISVGIARIAKGCSYKIVTPAVKVGQVTILGEGPTSKLLCDSTVLTVTSGTGSFVDNVWMENLTAPYIVTRNPANWAAVINPAQSNGLGYQPTVNDPEYAAWVAAQPLVGTQNIGPTLLFQGIASDISVSRIYGRFVNIRIMDAQNSTVRDCDYQGGKYIFAALVFDNCTNNLQPGQNNQAINNRIGYASSCGIRFFSNVDFTYRGNTCYNCGESGTSTAQAGGVAFTASVGGASGGTLNAPFASPTGTWTFGFPDGTTRQVTVANGQTVVAWAPAVAAGNFLNAAYWGALGLPASVMDPRCGRGQIVDNRTYNNYFDGLDCDSTFGITNDATQTHHQIHNNYSFRNRGDGMNIDGQFNSVVGNHLFFNGNYGIWGICSLAQIVGNFLIDNNQLRNAALAEILAVGALGQNKIADNMIWGGPTQNCPAIVVPQGILNYVSDNLGLGVSNNNLGNLGFVASVADGNIDNLTGAFTPQSFCFQLVNNGGILQHIFYSDASAQSIGLYNRINGASSGGFTNTPTGADAATAMAAGAKIGSALTNAIWLDTLAQNNTGILFTASVVFNNTGTALNVKPMLQGININGVTRQRLTFQFTNAATGAAFALNTANITVNNGIYVQFNGKLS